jgi:DNA-binding MarR family transcriptional regulator
MPGSPAPTPEDTAAALRAALGILYRRIKQTRNPVDLTLPESSALSRLERNGPISAAELARLEQISPQSMGSTLARLEQRGLISRTADPGDGRRQLLAVTRAGTALVHAKRSARDQQINRALQTLTPAELAQLDAVLPLLERIAREL